MVAGGTRTQARRQLNWNGGGGGMDSQYKLLSELLSDQAAFITSPKTSLANYWGALLPCPPVSTGLEPYYHYDGEAWDHACHTKHNQKSPEWDFLMKHIY